MDLQLVKYFAEDFSKKYKIDVFGNPKRLLRLMGEVEKVKKMMSTVTNNIPLNIECFADDRDVSSSVKRWVVILFMLFFILSVFVYRGREIFEELCGELINRVKLTLETALAKSSKCLIVCSSDTLPWDLYFSRL